MLLLAAQALLATLALHYRSARSQEAVEATVAALTGLGNAAHCDVAGRKLSDRPRDFPRCRIGHALREHPGDIETP